MEDVNDPYSLNEYEVLEYYGLKGISGKFNLKCKFIKTWILHSLAYFTPLSSFIIKMQRARGVKIGKFCHISPYVLIDLVYPQLIKIEDNVTIGNNSMIFAHVNPTASVELKKNFSAKNCSSNNKKRICYFSWMYYYCWCHYWRTFYGWCRQCGR